MNQRVYEVREVSGSSIKILLLFWNSAHDHETTLTEISYEGLSPLLASCQTIRLARVDNIADLRAVPRSCSERQPMAPAAAPRRGNEARTWRQT